MTAQPHVRWMIRRDMREVVAIETNAFKYPWREHDFIMCLKQRNCIGMVVSESEHTSEVLGYMMYELHKTRLQLLSFAVDKDAQRQGYGAAMVQKLVSKLSPYRRTKIVCEVSETNLDAQLFFRAQGFKATRVLKSFYEDSTEDAYEFEYCVEEPAFNPVGV